MKNKASMESIFILFVCLGQQDWNQLCQDSKEDGYEEAEEQHVDSFNRKPREKRAGAFTFFLLTLFISIIVLMNSLSVEH